MNNDLIQRIDNCNEGVAFPNKILADCKAEIQRLLLANETLKGLCEEYQAQIKQAREYIPIDEIIAEIDGLLGKNPSDIRYWIDDSEIKIILDKYRAKESL